MRTDLLLQFIVPLTFLAIWALTSLLNRESQPLPPRPGRAPGPGGGPRSTSGPAMTGRGELEKAPSARPLAASRAPAPLERPAPARWSPALAQARPQAGGRSGEPDEGILILESETRMLPSSSTALAPPSAASGRTMRAAVARRAATRGRPTQPALPKSTEPERTRVLTGLSGQPLGLKKSRPLEIAPLSTQISPLSSPLSRPTSPTPPEAPTNRPTPTLTSGDLRTMLASPARLREIALLGELLQPPVALRSLRRPR